MVGKKKRKEDPSRRFVEDLVHDFRTPLAAIRGYAETLIRGSLNDPKNRLRFTRIILKHARRLERVLAALSDSYQK